MLLGKKRSYFILTVFISFENFITQFILCFPLKVYAADGRPASSSNPNKAANKTSAKGMFHDFVFWDHPQELDLFNIRKVRSNTQSDNKWSAANIGARLFFENMYGIINQSHVYFRAILINSKSVY